VNVTVGAVADGPMLTESAIVRTWPDPSMSTTAGCASASALPLKPRRKARSVGEEPGDQLRGLGGDRCAPVERHPDIPAV